MSKFINKSDKHSSRKNNKQPNIASKDLEINKEETHASNLKRNMTFKPDEKEYAEQSA